VQSRPEPRAGFLFGNLRPDELCQNEVRRLVLRVTEAKAFNDSPLLALLFFGGGRKSSTSPRHLSADHCIFIVNGNGNSGSVQRNRWDERRVVSSVRHALQPVTGSRQENAMRADGIGATQPVDVKFQCP